METTLTEIPFEQLARQLKLSPVQIQNAVALLDEGWSIPFLAQYRLDHTDGVSERLLSRLARELTDIRQMQQRKSSLVEYLSGRGALPPDMELEIQSADTREKVEHLHAILKRNRQPKAIVERNEAVEALVERVLDGSITPEALTAETEKRAAESDLFTSADDAAAAVRELIVIRFSHSLPVRQRALDIIRETGALKCRRYQAGDDGSPAAAAEPDEPAPAAPPEASPAREANAETPVDTTAEAAAETTTGPAPEPATEPASSHPTTEPGALSASAATADSTAPAAVADSSTAEPSPAETTPAETTPTETTPVTQPAETQPAETQPAARSAKSAGSKSSLSLAEQRRQRRKESRLRRRAHLEATLKSYFDARFPLGKLTPSQFADIDYGERVRVLTAVLEFDRSRLQQEAAKLVVPAGNPHQALIEAAWQEALERFVIPDCERIVRRYFAAQVEQQGMASIKRRVRNLCMQRPIPQPVLAVTGHRDGFSVAVLGADGTTLHSEDLLRNDYGPDKIKQRVGELVEQHAVAVVAIAEGPRTRLAEQLATESLGQQLKEQGAGWFIVASDGLEHFCKTAIGCEEIPNVPPERRVAIALGRRAQNPLFEFVKCAPRDWLTEQQQTIVDIKRLSEEIRHVYQSCLARVGVDVNRASAAVLSLIPGLDESITCKIEAQAKAGKITCTTQIRDLAELSPQGYAELCGFLRINDGDNPLDALGIHPDHHDAALKVLKRCDFTLDMLSQRMAAVRQASTGQTDAGPRDATADWAKALRGVNLAELSGQVGVGKEQLKRIVNELCFAGRDIRLNSLLPVIRDSGFALADLKAGDLFAGRVVNVASFGAFVEIAQGVTGLLHISRLGDRFVRDPRELVMPGETIPVWIVSVDREKQRIALSISPLKHTKGPTAKPTGRGPRPPRKAGGRTESRRPRKTDFKPRPARKPKPVVPLTDEMKTGAEPMRTFGDLKQFYDISQDNNTSEQQSPEKKSPEQKPLEQKSPQNMSEQKPSEQIPDKKQDTPPLDSGGSHPSADTTRVERADDGSS